jgi:hypothetical protein
MRLTMFMDVAIPKKKAFVIPKTGSKSLIPNLRIPLLLLLLLLPQTASLSGLCVTQSSVTSVGSVR